ncbi:DMT family transporter [uncultured Croceicoccus sp.]|uniref:EamA family transporter n=1 Tax=uncultured Croceicoccus sp. TaxID=1295329 RepID=UPI002619C32C|nr:DMT family transporter [uncultured Croceicoccus sp.]
MTMTQESGERSGGVFAPIKPFGALLAAMVTLAIGTSIGKSLFPHVGAAGTVAYRVGFSALFLLAIWRPWRRRYSAAEWRLFAAFGASLGLMNLCFYLSLRTVPLGIAIATEFMGPLGVALWSTRRPRDLAWLALTLVGLALLLPIEETGSRLDPAGMAFAASAGVFWALYIVLGGKLAHQHAGHSIAIAMGVAAVIVVPVGVFSANAALLDPRFIATGMVVAAVSSAIPYSLEMVALKHIPARVFGTLTSVEPAMGAVAGFLFLHELLSPRQGIAIVCVILASAGTAMTARREADPVLNELPPA